MSIKPSVLSLSILTLLLAAAPAWGRGAGVVKFDERRYEVSEEEGMVAVEVERSGGEDGAITVQVMTGGGSATASVDYTPVTALLSWEDGDEEEKSFVVQILADGETEPPETIELVLASPTGGAEVHSERGRAVIVIRDGDDDGEGPGGGGHGDAGQIKFDQRGFQVLETGGMAVISVERSHGDEGAVSIDYATGDGTATGDEDYTGAAGTLSWDDGEEDAKTFMVPILDDDFHEPSETVRLTLSNPTGGATLHGHNAILVIRDDERPGDDDDEDGPGEFEFRRESFPALEGSGEAMIVVKRDDGDDGAVSVDFATGDLTATDGEDYTGAAGTLFWDDGDDAPKSFTVPILDDDLEEGAETVLLTLTNPTGGATIDDEEGEAELVIVDDDGQTTPCTESETVLCLHDRRFQVEVTWRTPNGGTGAGHALPLTDSAGLFWFFDADNIEMLFKVIDACDTRFDAYWVFLAATTNVDFTVTVTDTASGVVMEYSNPNGQAAEPVQDTLTFHTCS